MLSNGSSVWLFQGQCVMAVVITFWPAFASRSISGRIAAKCSGLQSGTWW